MTFSRHISGAKMLLYSTARGDLFMDYLKLIFLCRLSDFCQHKYSFKALTFLSCSSACHLSFAVTMRTEQDESMCNNHVALWSTMEKELLFCSLICNYVLLHGHLQVPNKTVFLPFSSCLWLCLSA